MRVSFSTETLTAELLERVAFDANAARIMLHLIAAPPTVAFSDGNCARVALVSANHGVAFVHLAVLKT